LNLGIIGWLAIYGAFVATVALIWNGISVYRDRSCIKVKMKWAYKTYGEKVLPEKHIAMIAINKGRRSVIISGAGFTLSDTWNFTYMPYPKELPRTLSEGDSIDILFDLNGLKEDAKKRGATIEYGWFRDKADRTYKGKIPKDIKKELN